MEEADFGSYLVAVYERDIDLLLMEEFHISADFVSWFARHTGVEGATFAGAWHSVTDADGETDLLLRVRDGSRRIGILIENKVAAPEQDRQDERYHLRAARAQQAGKFDDFVTCICAPQIYLEGLLPERLYQRHIPYEAIADWFGALTGPRHGWRHRVMVEAIRQGRRGYTMVINPAVSEFHRAFWEHIQHHYPAIVMRRPTPKGNKSSWIVMKGHDFPPGVQLHFKMDQSVVELGFGQRRVSDLLVRKSDWPEGIMPIQKGETAALAIRVPAIDRMQPLSSQHESLEAVLQALMSLLPFGRLFDVDIDHPT